MLWVWLALGAALSLSLTDVLAKRAMAHADAAAVGWLKFAGAALVTLPLLLVTPWPAFGPFLGYLAVAIPLEVAAIILYNRAIALSPLSLSVPMLAFTPVFLLLTGWLLLGERPEPAGAAGVLLVTGGAYVLHLRRQGGWLAPFRGLATEPGSRLMLLVALLYSVTAALGKKLVLLSSPSFFGAFYPAAVALTLTPVLASGPRRAGLTRTPFLLLAAIAVLYGLMVILHFQAIALAPAAYMIAVKRSSLLFAVLWGRLFFGEAAGWSRVAGAALMIAGVFALTL